MGMKPCDLKTTTTTQHRVEIPMRPFDGVGLWVIGRGEGQPHIGAVKCFDHGVRTEVSGIISVHLPGMAESGEEGLQFPDDALAGGGR